MRIHLIATGGALMHNLALALQQQGHTVTGSDDEIYEPARSRLQRAGLLPPSEGWDVACITPELDLVIVGMHARRDNPELERAQALDIPIYSYPAYLYEQSVHKTRVVVAGSHGKTTTTSLIMHILRHNGIQFDYAVGAMVEGFDTMVRLSDAPIMVIEGDEYLSSPLDSRPKFLHYRPHIAVLTGIAWDHINVFPTFAQYRQAFADFIESMPAQSSLIYCKRDAEVVQLVAHCDTQHLQTQLGYAEPTFYINDNQTFIQFNTAPSAAIPLQVFGKHNLQNIQAARHVCRELGLTDTQIGKALASFAGAAKRLEKWLDTPELVVYRDFAHAPSKVQATVQAIRDQYPTHHIIAGLELHTFSSLNQHFIHLYAHTLDAADEALVYCNPHTFAHKKLPVIAPEIIAKSFAHRHLSIFSDINNLLPQLPKRVHCVRPTILLLMSSGNWANIPFEF